MIDERQRTIADVPDALPEGWDRPSAQTVTFRHQGREVTLNAADLRRVTRNLEEKKRMPKTLVKVAVNVQASYGAPTAEEVAERIGEAYQSALASQKATGGKTQVVVEWTREDED